MKKCTFSVVLAVLLLAVLPLGATGRGEQRTDEADLVVYAYDSFVSQWGPGPQLVADFKELSGYSVQLVSVGSASELLRRVIVEQEHPRADLVVGVPQGMLQSLLESHLFVPYRSPYLAEVPDFLRIDESGTFIPFNYGNFSFVYDSEKVTEPPQSLDDLLDGRWKKKIILIDPRTSSVGMGLLEWTIAQYGDDYLSWWQAMRDNILTIAESWSSAYGLFTQGEAPVVLSYTTSIVYHLLSEDSDRYLPTIFAQGNGTVIEGLALLGSSVRPDVAQAFIDFLLSEGQATIAVGNSMYPVNSNTQLPSAFEMAPKPEISLLLDASLVEKNRDKWLTEWVEAMSK